MKLSAASISAMRIGRSVSLRGGEAYRVLEILVGDLVCLLDSSQPAPSPAC